MSGHANDHFWPSLGQSYRPETMQISDQIPFHDTARPLCLFRFRFWARAWGFSSQLSVFRLPILATGIEIGQLPAPCCLLPAAGLPNEAIICGPVEHNCRPSSA